MKKILTIVWTVLFLGCSTGADVNQALNEEIAIKKQEISQEHKIFQLENDSLGASYRNWEKSIQKKFPAQDPIIFQHQKNIKAYQEVFQDHQKHLSNFRDSLESFTKILEKHSLGQMSDEILNQAYQKIEQNFNNLRTQHRQLIEDHQTFQDAHETLVNTYLIKE